jgi:putative transposase
MGRSSRRSPKLRQRRLTGVDEIVLCLYARVDQWGDRAHFAEICGASVSKQTVSRITDKVSE